MLASPDLPARAAVALRVCVSAGEALPRDIGERFTAHFGCEILDGIGSTEMLHIFLSNRAGDVQYGTTGVPVPGYDVELRGEDGRPVADGEVGDLYIRGPSAALMYWTNHAKSRATFQGEWTRERRQVRAPRRRLLRLCRPRRRHAEGERPVRIAVRSRGGARPASGGARGRRDREARRRRPHEDQGVRRAEVRPGASMPDSRTR